jgi:hypothetical protein
MYVLSAFFQKLSNLSQFMIGMAFVLYATYLYGTPDKKPPAPTGEPSTEYQLPNMDEGANDSAPALEQKR